MHSTLPKLDEAFRQKLEDAAEMKATLTGVDQTWDEVVKLARRKLTTGRASAPPAAPQGAVHQPQASSKVPAPAPVIGSKPQNRGGSGDSEEKECKYCSTHLPGLGGNNHSSARCYTDPQSKLYKPDFRKRKLEIAKRKGIQLSPAMLQELESGSLGMVGEAGGMVSDLEGAFRLIGAYTEEEV